MQFVNLDQQIFVPVVDETHGGATYEMKMTVGEFFEKCCSRFAPEVVEAIPMDWMDAQIRGYASALKSTELKALVLVKQMWEREQEAQDGKV